MEVRPPEHVPSGAATGAYRSASAAFRARQVRLARGRRDVGHQRELRVIRGGLHGGGANAHPLEGNCRESGIQRMNRAIRAVDHFACLIPPQLVLRE
jgi:hypothetical protein